MIQLNCNSYNRIKLISPIYKWENQRCLTQFVLEKIKILKVDLINYKDYYQTSQFYKKI